MKLSYNTAVFAGSFDPTTKGHVWVANEMPRMFKKSIILVTNNPKKKYLFPLDERVRMIRNSVPASINVVSHDSAFTVRYAAAVGAGILVRSVRNETDFLYERTLAQVNADIEPEVRTILLLPPQELCHISSSLVRDMIGPTGWQEAIKKYLPTAVYEQMLVKFSI